MSVISSILNDNMSNTMNDSKNKHMNDSMSNTMNIVSVTKDELNLRLKLGMLFEDITRIDSRYTCGEKVYDIQYVNNYQSILSFINNISERDLEILVEKINTLKLYLHKHNIYMCSNDICRLKTDIYGNILLPHDITLCRYHEIFNNKSFHHLVTEYEPSVELINEKDINITKRQITNIMNY